MFTGIVEGIGRIGARRKAGGGVTFDIATDFDLDDPSEGESIAVLGVCLTAYNIGVRSFTADVSPETLSRTKLGRLGIGSPVNLERALKVSDRLGGHIVSGHVDCLATVTERKPVGEYTVFGFSLPREHDRYVIEKGSITVDGTSLTVNSCGPGNFSVSIIPHSLNVTTLGALKVGDSVNIEVDIIGKYVEKLLTPADGKRSEAINADFLAQHGFF
jgi:riboflavin synthase